MRGRDTIKGTWAIGAWVMALVLLLAPTTEAHYRFDQIGLAQGLSQSRVIALAEDSNGYMWMGTEAGLNRYDGYSIEPFATHQPNAGHMTDSRIAALYAGRAGELWVATAFGVSVLDIDTNQSVFLPHQDARPAELSQQPRLAQAGHQHAQFFEDCHNRVWALRSRHIFSFAQEQGQWRQTHEASISVPPAYGAEIGLSARRDANGTLWLADHSSLWRITCQEPSLELVLQRSWDEKNLMPVESALAFHGDEQLVWARQDGMDIINLNTGLKEGEHSAESVVGEAVAFLGIQNDDEGRVWLLSSMGIDELKPSPLGLGKDPSLVRFYTTQSADQDRVLRSDESLFSVQISRDGLLWSQSRHGTVVIDPRLAYAEKMRYDPTRPQSYPAFDSSPWYRLYRDRFGVVWLSGGLSGMALYSAERNRFNRLSNTDWLYQSARSLEVVEVDGARYIWTAWDGSRLNLWRQANNGVYEKLSDFGPGYQDMDDQPWAMMRSMTTTGDGIVWMASSESIWRADTRAQTLERVHVFEDYIDHDGYSRYSNIGLIYDAARNQLIYSHAHDVWSVSLDGVRQIATVERLDWMEEPGNARSNLSLLQLKDGRLVMGSFSSIQVVDLEQQQVVIHDRGFSALGRPEQVVVSLSEDEAGFIWLGTRNGLGRYALSKDSQTFEQLAWVDELSGLADATIYAIVHDHQGAVWVSTNRGVSRILPGAKPDVEFAIRNYSVVDGLSSYEFNSRAVKEDRDGNIYLGSVSGLTYFNPADLNDHPRPPDVLLSSVAVNDEPQAVSQTELALSLDFSQNNLAIAYTGVHFSVLAPNDYAYQLEGHEVQWVMAGGERTARYANLPPGRYQFWVRAANLDGIWSDPKKLLAVTIRPPPWATPAAYVSYMLSLLVLLLLITRSAVKRQQRLEQLVADRTVELGHKNQLIEAQSAQLQEALEARTLFFANISHEFRTPLTLIQTAIEQLDPEGRRPEARRLARRYLQRLVRLVDQLLDLSRLRLSGVERASAPWSVNQIVAITVDGFSYLAKERGIEFDFLADGDYRTQVDQASVEKILLNLLSNAFKYTPEGGKVSVSLHAEPPQVTVIIKDSGPGIDSAQHERIFERFQRIPSQETLLKEGAGIGLALVKEAASAIGGSVTLESALDQGSAFAVHFPGWADTGTEPGSSESSAQYLSGNRLQLDRELLSADGTEDLIGQQIESNNTNPGEHTLLVVEDNIDLRRYLTELLADQWRVFQAPDGIAALEILEKEEIDVVLSDIMMPKMDGLSLLEAVRDNLETSHIPFVLLSARHDTDTRLMGLTLAADDFLTKPFSAEEIRLKLKNIVLSRQLLRAAILRGFSDEADRNLDKGADKQTQKHLCPRDHKFLERLNHWLAEHHAKPEQTVTDMASSLSVNERTLQRKIRALTGLTPMNFLTQYRLEKGKTMLRDPSLSIQEIAFDLGFNSQQAFSRAFKQHFSQTPSQWRVQYFDTKQGD